LGVILSLKIEIEVFLPYNWSCSFT